MTDVRGLPELGDAWAIETGALARVRPTLIIGSVPYRPETLAKLLEWPAPFVATNPRTIADIFTEIRLLGALAGCTAGAARLIRRMQGDFRQVDRLARRARTRPRVYAEAWPHPRISSPPWVAELVEMAGGKMVVAAGCRLTDAAVRQARPEVILLAWTAAGERSQPAQLLRNSAWQSVPAVRTGRVVAVPDHWLNTPGPPLVKGLRLLFRLLHPELASLLGRRHGKAGQR